MPETLLKKKLWHRCFSVNFAKFLRTRFLQNTSGRLLLILVTKPKFGNFPIFNLPIAETREKERSKVSQSADFDTENVGRFKDGAGGGGGGEEERERSSMHAGNYII